MGVRGGARHAPHGAKGAAGTRGDGSQLERCSRDSRQWDTLCHRWGAPCHQWDALCNWGYALCHRWDICVTSGMSPVAGGGVLCHRWDAPWHWRGWWRGVPWLMMGYTAGRREQRGAPWH